jgi:RimJ/RimL family protein N-acetyltransferase
MGGKMTSEVSIRPYREGDMWILERTLGDPRQMVHLNGPESSEKIRERHTKYVKMSADQRAGCMFTIMVGTNAAGNVGYWESECDGQKVWEAGWFVLPEYQGRGIATEAMKHLIGVVSKLRSHRFLTALPSVDNHPSNAIPRKLGFTLVREIESEYPHGSGKFLHNNVWRLVLPAELPRATPDPPNLMPHTKKEIGRGKVA